MSLPPPGAITLLAILAVFILFELFLWLVSSRDVERPTSHKASHGRGRRRIVVGECEKCARPLRTRPAQIKTVLHLTCRCGFHNLVVPEEMRATQPVHPGHLDLRSIRDQELERRARSPLGAKDEAIARRLCVLSDMLKEEGEPADREIKRIAQELFDGGVNRPGFPGGS